jgi:NitT/TauT family transport system substrate-binding protein
VVPACRVRRGPAARRADPMHDPHNTTQGDSMQRKFDRRDFIGASALAAATLAVPARVRAQALERKKVTIAVGGKNLLYYLPLTVAEQLKYFEAEGLEASIVDFAGGARALQAVVGGSADVVSGAFEHTLNMQAKGQPMRAFVLQGRAPQIVLAVSTKTMPNYKTVADLKGKKIGVTAPGSSTNIMANFVLAKAGLKPGDVSIVGVGASQGAVAAMRAGQIDAMSNLDPVMTILQRSGDIKIVSDTRDLAEADKVFGGPMPAACLYAPVGFLEKNPNVAQALTNAIVRANKWIQQAGPSDIIKVVPESYLLGDRAIYIDAFLKAKGALSPDGMIPDAGSATALRALASVDEAMAKAKLDLKANYTNDFVKKANAKYPKG